MLTVGIDLVLISALIYVIEIAEWTQGKWTSFFTVVGKNPLPVYLFSELLGTIVGFIVIGKSNPLDLFNQDFCQVMAPGPIGSLIFAIVYMLICWLFGWLLDKNKIYLRV